MTGRTNYTAIDNTAEFGFDQINAGLDHFDALTGESVATAAALPATGNWNGRTILVLDTSLVYVYNGGWRISMQNKWVSLAGTASGTLTVSTGWLNLAPVTTIPTNPFGAGVNYVVEAYGFTTQTPGAGGGFAIRCQLDGAAMGIGGFAQVIPSAQTTLPTFGRSNVTTPGSTHTVAVQIEAVGADSTVQTGATISGYWVELKRLGLI